MDRERKRRKGRGKGGVRDGVRESERDLRAFAKLPYTNQSRTERIRAPRA